MDLSIIIVNFNTKELTLAAIKSIVASKIKPSFEIIVVDNGSTDGSVSALRDSSSKLRLIENRTNLGFAKANNQGIKAAKGKYVLLLNSDTKVKDGAIDALYDFAQNTPDAGVVAPKLLSRDGSIQGSVFRLPTLGKTIRQFWFGEKGLLNKYAPHIDTAMPVEAAVMAAFLITPAAIKKAGYLDERYFMYFEDLDYCRKLKKAGLKVYYLPAAQVFHYHGASGKKVAKAKDQWKRLIPSSKIYHGGLTHTLLTGISWTGQKFGKYVPLALLLLLIIPTFIKLFQPGYFPMQDDLQAFRVQQMDKCLGDLQIPCRWVPDAGYQFGYPQFNFYPPLPYYLGAILHRGGAVAQYIDSVKILFIVGYIFSAFTMYLLVKTITRDRWAGFIAGLLYTYIPYKAVEVFVRGALSEFWAQIFFPLILWAVYQLVKTGKTRYLVWTGLSVAALATTHSLMTMIFAPIISLWALFWLYVYKFKNLKLVVGGGLLAVGLAAFFILPVAFERQYAHIESLLSGYFDYRQHFVSLYKLFISREWGYGSSGFPDEKLNLSLGLIHWVLGLVVAPVLALASFRKNKQLSLLTLGVSAFALGSIFMMHMKSSFIWAKLPFLWYLQFPWRFLAVSIFLLCLAGGLAIYFSGKWKYWLGTLLVLISAILYLPFFTPKAWLFITDADKFSGVSWEKQLTISIFDYLPIYGVLPPWSKAPDLPEVIKGEVKFSDYKKGSNFQTGTFEAKGDARLRLPLFDFPGMVVTIDGEKVAHVNNDCTDERYCRGLISLDVPAGKHELAVRLTDTPVRKVGNFVSLAAIMVLVALVLVPRKHEEISS